MKSKYDIKLWYQTWCQNIISKDDKTFNALMDISPKFPIGVDMMYKILLSTLILLNVFVICSTLYYLFKSN